MLNQNTIHDIRAVKIEDSVYEAVMDGLQKDPRILPIMILYGTEGLQHWDRHSHAPDYYLRHEELQILRAQSHKIAESIADNSAIVDLGSGGLDKLEIILNALEEQKKRVTYYALDLSREELESTLHTLPSERYQSTIGNFSRENAANFIRQMAESACTSPEDESSILLSIDSCKLPTKVLRAYTSDGVVPFAMAGLQHASSIIRDSSGGTEHVGDVFQTDDWYYLSEYNPIMGRHEASYTPRERDITLGVPLHHITIKKGEKIRFGYSHKYSPTERKELFKKAGVVAVDSWTLSGCDLGNSVVPPSRYCPWCHSNLLVITAFYQLKLAKH
ncbi:hypothetical protein AbraIFM66951_003147 [Aspergillus brasiliensis]|uniref:Histidine-specific methyltransferase SAM-dependent domain-containing protein n=1 Tax=Aspergillus brasiliensis TaxID=319629 RepID=A0A9W5YSY8_9EURO|nr:hypothetical protein AbraCBS73388_009638 [Aspergillus brasiliensis]GKZ50156.1 hypothetical protein AbraIFM66951_003147 [Aspergillus brasiliensis]